MLMQELDEAARRRLPKQLYIPLPCPAARKAMLERELGEPRIPATLTAPQLEAPCLAGPQWGPTAVHEDLYKHELSSI